MKKNIIVCGIISGLIVSVLMGISLGRFCSTGDFENGMIYGYASMILAFSLIFVGIKNYRDKYNHGAINFGKAFRIGFFIALISSSFYVAAWMIEYAWFFPDFMDKYSAHILENAQKAGASAAELAKKKAEMEQASEMYKNPLYRILMTYVEILPVGTVIALIAAAILKRKVKQGAVG